jgi:hypothetical protein
MEFIFHNILLKFQPVMCQQVLLELIIIKILHVQCKVQRVEECKQLNRKFLENFTSIWVAHIQELCWNYLEYHPLTSAF